MPLSDEERALVASVVPPHVRLAMTDDGWPMLSQDDVAALLNACRLEERAKAEGEVEDARALPWGVDVSNMFGLLDRAADGGYSPERTKAICATARQLISRLSTNHAKAEARIAETKAAAVLAVNMAERSLEDYCDLGNAGQIEWNARAVARTVWGAFSRLRGDLGLPPYARGEFDENPPSEIYPASSATQAEERVREVVGVLEQIERAPDHHLTDRNIWTAFHERRSLARAALAKLKAAPLQGEGSSSSRVEENSPSGRTSAPSSTGGEG